jgi:hypothetical protein
MIAFGSIRWRALVVVAISCAWLPVHVRGQAPRSGGGDVRGLVAGTDFSRAASHYQHAQVCADVNNDAACSPGEPTTMTDAGGAFALPTATAPRVGLPLRETDDHAA